MKRNWHEAVDVTTSDKASLVLIIVHSLACPCTVLLNALVIISLAKKRSMRSKSNVIIGYLAGSDIMIGLVSQPLLIATELIRLHGDVRGTHTLVCSLEDAYYTFTKILGLASLCHITLLNIERYIAMKHTLRHMVIVTQRRLNIAVASAWMLSICVYTSEKIHASIYAWLRYLVPASLVFCVFVSIYCCLVVTLTSRRHQRRIATEHKRAGLPKKMLQQNNASLLFVAITLLLVVSYGQIFVLKMLPKQMPMFQCVAESMLVLNSLFNPILYSARTSAFSRAFKEILGIHSTVNPINPPT